VVTGERLRRLSVAANTSRQLAGDDREARDRAIEEADQAGMSVREIARATGLAPGHVHRIITARAAARQA
jgi:ParB-like chromosome segregation protein Spo0J